MCTLNASSMACEYQCKYFVLPLLAIFLSAIVFSIPTQPDSQEPDTMATKRDEGIAAGFAEGGHEVKIPEGIVKPKDTNVDSEVHHPRGAEQSQLMDEASQRIAAGDARASQARIPEGIMKPVAENQRDDLPISASAIAAGRPLDAGYVKLPEAVVKPTTATAPLASPLAADVSGNVAGGQPLNASGFNVDESETKIPEGIMNPNSGNSANIAAGLPVDASGNQSAAEHAVVPEGITKPSMSS